MENHNKNPSTKTSDSGPQPVLVNFGDIPPQKLNWLWKNRIPLGKLTLLVGNPGTGKSVLTTYIAARVSTGKPWPDLMNDRIQVGSVILLTAEDDLHDTVRIRLEAAGADLDKVSTIQAVRVDGPNGKKERGLYNLTKDLGMLQKAIEQMQNTRLVIIDPISAYMGGKNQNENAKVREFLTPLVKLASDTDVAILGISHLNKNQKASAAYRTLGSIGFPAAARAVLLVAEDPQDPDRRLLIPAKGNLSKNPTGLAFRLDDVQVQTPDGMVASPKCRFESGAIYQTADEALGAYEKSNRGPTKLEEAAEWLRDKLSDGPRTVAEISKLADEAGISERTLDRAKRELGVVSDDQRDGGTIKMWTWRLPDKNAKDS